MPKNTLKRRTVYDLPTPLSCKHCNESITVPLKRPVRNEPFSCPKCGKVSVFSDDDILSIRSEQFTRVKDAVDTMQGDDSTE